MTEDEMLKMSADICKALAAERALELVQPGMKIGLGTGSTAAKGDATASGIDINPVPRDQLPDGGTLRWPLIA